MICNGALEDCDIVNTIYPDVFSKSIVQLIELVELQ